MKDRASDSRRRLVAAIASASLGLVLCLVGGAGTRGQQQAPAGPCDKATSTYEMSECWGEQFKKADAELNRVYKDIMSRLPDADKAKLREAQRAWIVQKEKKGDKAASEYEGGTFAPVAKTIALTDETVARTSELKRTYASLLPPDLSGAPKSPAPPPQGAGGTPQAPPKTLGKAPGVIGDWKYISGPTDFESMSLLVEDSQQVFRSYLHERPAFFGTWELSGEKLTVHAEGDMTFVWKIVSASSDKLVLKEEDETESTTFKKF